MLPVRGVREARERPYTKTNLECTLESEGWVLRLLSRTRIQRCGFACQVPVIGKDAGVATAQSRPTTSAARIGRNSRISKLECLTKSIS